MKEKLKWLEKNFESIFMCFGLILLSVLVLLQVIMRYVFHNPMTWSEELCRLVLTWSGFFSIGFCARRDISICLDVVVNALPAKIKRVIFNLTTVIMVILLAYLFKGSYELVAKTMASNSILPGLQIPQYWLYIGPMIGIGLGLIRFIQNLFRTHFYRNIVEKAGK